MFKRFTALCAFAAVMAVAAFQVTPAFAVPAVDPYSSYVGSPNAGSATDAAAVTPSDTVDLVTMSKWIGCGVAGNLNVITKVGTTVVITCVAGVPIPIVVSRIKATSTTATGIWVLTN